MKYLLLPILIIVIAGGVFYSSQRGGPPEKVQITSPAITVDQAVMSVKNLPEVQDYLKRVPNGKVEIDNEEEGQYNVHVYEVLNGHTATFNWYQVNMNDGTVKGEFPSTKDSTE